MARISHEKEEVIHPSISGAMARMRIEDRLREAAAYRLTVQARRGRRRRT